MSSSFGDGSDDIGVLVENRYWNDLLQANGIAAVIDKKGAGLDAGNPLVAAGVLVVLEYGLEPVDSSGDLVVDLPKGIVVLNGFALGVRRVKAIPQEGVLLMEIHQSFELNCECLLNDVPNKVVFLPEAKSGHIEWVRYGDEPVDSEGAPELAHEPRPDAGAERDPAEKDLSLTSLSKLVDDLPEILQLVLMENLALF